ncbi:17255_t:CDS:10, partial [Funneliformis caledonium]
ESNSQAFIEPGEVLEEHIIDEQIIDEQIIDEQIIDEQIIDEQIIEEQIIEEPIIEEARSPMEEDSDEMVEFKDDSVQGFFNHKDSVYAIDINPINEDIIISGGGDDKSFLWRCDTGEQLFELSGHTDSVTNTLFSKDGQYIASGGMDGKVKVWKVENGQLILSLEGSDEITWLDWHPKGNILLAGANDGTIWMWQIPSGNCMNVFAGHSSIVTTGQFTPDGKKIVSGSEDTSLIVWDPKTAISTLKISGEDARFHREGITCLAVNQESTLVLSGSTDTTAKLVNLTNGSVSFSYLSLLDHSKIIQNLLRPLDSQILATGSIDGKLNVWDVKTMRLRQTCNHDDAIIKLQWHKDSPLLTTCSADRTVRVWDGRTGKCETTFHGHQDAILGFAMSRDGKRIVTASDDHS